MKKKSDNPREEALDQCIEVLERGNFFKKSADPFTARLAAGTLERAIELDWRINRVSSRNIKRMHPVVRNILRIGAYQCLYMDSVPDRAAISECVNLAKKRGQARAGGLVNAVLRNMVRKGSAEKISDPAVRNSIPGWIYDMWVSEYGSERTDSFTEMFLLPPKTHVRTNKNGSTYIQDLSSQRVCIEAGVKENDRVLDVCASPGGKAIHAADIAGEGGSVTARDKSEEKKRILDENITNTGLTNIKTQVWDASVFSEKDVEKYDIVLADLPCSGLGVLKRKPEIKYRLNPEDIVSLSEIQREILDTVSSYVKHGGRLSYSTCTINSRENDSNTRNFIEKHKDFELISERQLFPDGEQDGFYIAVFGKI